MLKRFLFFCFVSVLLLFPCLANADITQIPEGVYLGKADFGSTTKHPLFGKLFIIASSGHIVGFSSPQNNPLLPTSFDETDLEGDFFTFTINGKVLKLKSNTNKFPKGIARFVKSNLFSSFKGYYSNESGGVVNVSADGLAIIFLGQGFGYVTFGKVSNEGVFNQLFGKKAFVISTDFSNNSVTVNVTRNGMTSSRTMFKN